DGCGRVSRRRLGRDDSLPTTGRSWLRALAPPGGRGAAGRRCGRHLTGSQTTVSNITRRNFVAGAVGSSAALWLAQKSIAAPNLAPIYAEGERRHAEAVARLQEWIRHYGIAAENNKVGESCDFTMGLLRDAGFQPRGRIPTARSPG